MCEGSGFVPGAPDLGLWCRSFLLPSLLHPITSRCAICDMLSFLGLANFSRNHVADFSELTHPLRQMVNTHGMRNLTATIEWSQDAQFAFTSLKQCLPAAADLALPDYSVPFHLDVSTKATSACAVLFQKKGAWRDTSAFKHSPHRNRMNNGILHAQHLHQHFHDW